MELGEQAERECQGGCQSAFVVRIDFWHSAELRLVMGCEDRQQVQT